jgi:hypothetical protein
MEIRADLIPNFLKASDPNGLRFLCMKNNASTGKFHEYQIIFDGKFWYAWYYSEVFDIPKGVK